VDLGDRGRFMLLSLSPPHRKPAELDRFNAFAAEAGAALVATPPAWGGLRRAGNPTATWAATLMFLAPSAVGYVLDKGGGRLITEPWAASVAALRDWHSKPSALQGPGNIGPQTATSEQEASTVETATGKANSTPRMTRQAANAKAMELAKADPSFVQRSLREWADAIGCSEGLVANLPFWRETMKQTGRGKEGSVPAPKAISLTSNLEAVTGEGGRDEQLKSLIAEQEADREPSPVDDDAPGSPPRKVYHKKRL
jgi:hypothetical protein